MDGDGGAEWRVEGWPYPPRQLFDLSGRVALVTGAASGLGRAIALGFDAWGAQVVLADRDRLGLEAVAAALTKPAQVLEVDVTDSAQVDGAIEAITRQWGRLDVAALIPGINVRKDAVELTDEEWDRVLDLNLSAMFRSARAVGRSMLAGEGGSVILMASARGLTGGRGQAVYSASKAGVIGLTRCLAWEWAPRVRVNALAPGYMATPLVASLAQDPQRRPALEALHALGRVASPEEIVGPAVFLASQASSFVTGAVLSVDGGWTAGQP